jgi:uncharacterized membrane protein YraQ (UPF0718 family)
MKWTIAALVALTLTLMVVAAVKGELGAGLRSAGLQGFRFLPVLVMVFLIMGLVEVILPQGMVERWLSDAAGWRGLAVAWLAGTLTPGGPVISMPLAAGLLRAGVSASVLVTYLTSVATLAVIRVPMELGFYGWRLAVLRVLASLILPLIAGVITRWLTPFFVPG